MRKCGVRFLAQASVKEWLAAPAKVEQQRIDGIVALVKAGSTEPSGLGEDAEPRSLEQLADDLGSVIRLIEDLENDLADSEDTLARHGLKLQNMDIAMQMLRAVAAELAPIDGEYAKGARLQDLRVACSQALADAGDIP